MLEGPRLGDLCDFYGGYRGELEPATPDQETDLRLVSGYNLRVGASLDSSSLARVIARSPVTDEAFIQIGDILLPMVTRSACVREWAESAGRTLLARTAIGLRAHSEETRSRVYDFILSPHFWNCAAKVSSTLRDNIRLLRDELRGIRLPAEDPDRSLLDASIAGLCDSLATHVANRPSILDRIEWRDLERLIAFTIEKSGFEVELTPPAKDGGKDVIVKHVAGGKDRLYLVEIKHWVCGNRVNEATVEAFVNVVARERADFGVLLSTSGFTTSAFQTLTKIQQKRLRAVGRKSVVHLCQSYSRTRGGLWSAGAQFESLFDDTSPVHER
jgi:hypothetical protein